MRFVLLAVVTAAVGVALGSAIANYKIGPADSIDMFRSMRMSPGGQTAPATSPSAVPGRGAPRFAADSMTFDFGEMQRGSTQSHEFMIRNIGTAPLEVRVSGSSCKCTVGDVDERPIAPGETVPVVLRWTAKTLAGPFRQTASLRTTDPLQPEVELSVEGTVVDVAGLEPQMWYLGRMRAGETQTASVTLMAYQQDELSVTKAEMVDESMAVWFDIAVVPLAKDELPDTSARAGVRIDVTNKTNIPLGELNAWVHVESNLPPENGQSTWAREIGIAGRVVGDLSVRGTAYSEQLDAVSLGWVQGSQGAEAKLFISAKGEHAEVVDFEVVTVSSPLVQVETGETNKIRDGVTHTDLVVRVPAGSPPANHLGSDQGEAVTVLLKTNHPITPEMKFNVRFGVR
jgi:hypothetical protein